MYGRSVNHSESTGGDLRAALQSCLEHCTPAVITFRSEGEDWGMLAEVADLDGLMVALFPFEAGMVIRLGLNQITGVEMWEGAVA